MTDKKTDTTVSKNDTVENTLKQWAIDKAELVNENTNLKEELAKAKHKLLELDNIVQSDIRADAIMRITMRSNFTRGELESLPVNDLLKIEETLSKTKGVDATYKPIRAGTASESQSRMTAGNLFGKSRKEILDMGGDF